MCLFHPVWLLRISKGRGETSGTGARNSARWWGEWRPVAGWAAAVKVALRDVRHEYSQFPELTVPPWPYLFTAALADRERRAGFSILQRWRLSREWICSRFKVPPKVRIRTGLNSGLQALIVPLPTHCSSGVIHRAHLCLAFFLLNSYMWGDVHGSVL